MSEASEPRRRSFRKVRPPPGARPGALSIPAGSPAPRIHLYRYTKEALDESEVRDVEDLARLPEGPGTTWIDVRGLGDEAVIRRIGEIFRLHPLALADAVNVPQRAKSELYEGHQLVIARMPILDDEGGVDVPQVAFVLGRGVLISFQERSFGFFDPVRVRLREGIGPIRDSGPDYLAYALIDTLIDRYYPIAEALHNELEDVEEEAISPSPGPEVLETIHDRRRLVVVLRRIGRPQRDAVRDLAMLESPFVGAHTRTYLRDTHDHISQVIELVDSTHEMAVALVEIYLSNVGQRTNEIMKVLTLMASIFIPLSFIAGVYGMNFDNMPELHGRWGYPLVLGAMATVATGMLLFFRRRGWIGRGRSRRRG